MGQGLNWAGCYPFLSLPVLFCKVGVTCLLQKVVAKSSDAQNALVPPLAAARQWSHVTESFPRSTRVLLVSRGSLFCAHVDLYGRVRTHDGRMKTWKSAGVCAGGGAAHQLVSAFGEERQPRADLVPCRLQVVDLRAE